MSMPSYPPCCCRVVTKETKEEGVTNLKSVTPAWVKNEKISF